MASINPSVSDESLNLELAPRPESYCNTSPNSEYNQIRNKALESAVFPGFKNKKTNMVNEQN